MVVAQQPQEFERLAEDLYWSGDLAGSIAALERAFVLYRDVDDERRAGYMALLLSHRAGEVSPLVGAGWHQKAATLLAKDVDCEEKAWFLAFSGNAMKFLGELDLAHEYFDQADRVGGVVGSRDVQAYVRGARGAMLATTGAAREGVALIDEAMVGAVSGELSRLAASYCFCYMLDACQRLGDYGRASEWVARSRGSATVDAIGFPGDCRLQHCTILRIRGLWDEALAEGEAALVETEHWPAKRAAIHYQLGMLKLCRGDLSAADEAFRRAHAGGYEPQPGLAMLACARGDADAGARSIAASLSAALDAMRGRDQDPSEFLAAAAEITAGAGRIEDAERALVLIASLEETQRTPVVRARAAYARGAVAVAKGASADGLSLLTTSLEAWRDIGAPFEVARARLLLAESYRRAGDTGRAALEIGAARETFLELRAPLEAKRATRMLEAAAAGPAPGLTQRELEVLRLVVRGRTNKEIAEQLFISLATVERHVANIYRKIGVRSRVEATAYALGRNLL
jgi:DNA-binding CsgD family transcriptional regulator